MQIKTELLTAQIQNLKNNLKMYLGGGFDCDPETKLFNRAIIIGQLIQLFQLELMEFEEYSELLQQIMPDEE